MFISVKQGELIKAQGITLLINCKIHTVTCLCRSQTSFPQYLTFHFELQMVM